MIVLLRTSLSLVLQEVLTPLLHIMQAVSPLAGQNILGLEDGGVQADTVVVATAIAATVRRTEKLLDRDLHLQTVSILTVKPERAHHMAHEGVIIADDMVQAHVAVVDVVADGVVKVDTEGRLLSVVLAEQANLLT